MNQADTWGDLLPLHSNCHETQSRMPICILVHVGGKKPRPKIHWGEGFGEEGVQQGMTRWCVGGIRK